MSRYAGLRHIDVEEPEPGLLVVRLNRPEVHNALNTATSEDLRTAFGPLAFRPARPAISALRFSKNTARACRSAPAVRSRPTFCRFRGA